MGSSNASKYDNEKAQLIKKNLFRQKQEENKNQKYQIE